MSEGFKPLSAGLGPVFADLERRAQATLDLTAKVRAALTGPEKDHILSATYRQNTLVVLADAAAWCPHIRYAQAQLMQRLGEAATNGFMTFLRYAPMARNPRLMPMSVPMIR